MKGKKRKWKEWDSRSRERQQEEQLGSRKGVENKKDRGERGEET